MLLNKISKLLILMNTLYVSVQSKTKQTNNNHKKTTAQKHEESALLIFFSAFN